MYKYGIILVKSCLMCKVASKCKAHYRPQCKQTQNKLSSLSLRISHIPMKDVFRSRVYIYGEDGVKTGIWSLGMLLVSSRAAEEVTKLPTQETTIVKKKMQRTLFIFAIHAYIDIITLDHGGRWLRWQC